jgi:hypothetical protein
MENGASCLFHPKMQVFLEAAHGMADVIVGRPFGAAGISGLNILHDRLVLRRCRLRRQILQLGVGPPNTGDLNM